MSLSDTAERSLGDAPERPAAAPAGAAGPACRPWRLTPWARRAIYALYAFAAYSVVRNYTLKNVHYLVFEDYLSGRERLPFQKRMLPTLVIEQLRKIPIPESLLHAGGGIRSSRVLFGVFAVDLAAFAVASLATLWLYRRIAPKGVFGLLVYPLFIHATVWTYILPTEHNFYYEYDMPSLAFFALGLCFVHARRFWPLLAVIAVGSFNRETTLFLIAIYGLDALARAPAGQRAGWRRVPWDRVALLAAIWLAIKLWLDHRYALNDRSEDYFRLWENIGRLTPNHWAQVMGGCGFLLPIVWLLRRRVPDPRIAAWLAVIPAWFAVMCCYGVLLETRIYGELCPLVAIAAALLLEGYVAQLPRRGAPGGGAGAEASRP